MEQLEHIRKLYEAYLDGGISAADRKVLMELLGTASDEDLGQLATAYLDKKKTETDTVEYKEHTMHLYENIKDRIRPATKLPQPHRGTWFLRLSAAAAAILLIAFFIYRYSSNDLAQHIQTQPAAIGEDVLPGRNRAALQLSDGKLVPLDVSNTGTLAEDVGVEIIKSSDGQIIYRVQEGDENLLGYNTITTPNGGQYAVILPDGTQVQLNAASSLRYPTRFEGASRRVELTGEAYFEVAKNAKMPFIVATENQQVKVLGTHFNIDSYGDNGHTVTTLVEGSVLVQSGHGKALLKPGENATLASGEITVGEADLETDLAWKNGMMEYRGENLEAIMKDISRWYDIEVVFDGQIPQRKFVVSVPRSAKLSTLLKVLQLSKVNFSMKEGSSGRTLIVKP